VRDTATETVPETIHCGRDLPSIRAALCIPAFHLFLPLLRQTLQQTLGWQVERAASLNRLFSFFYLIAEIESTLEVFFIFLVVRNLALYRIDGQHPVQEHAYKVLLRSC